MSESIRVQPLAPRAIRWRPLTAAVIVVVALLAAAGYLWLRSYSPIEPAGTSGVGPGSLALTAAPGTDPARETTTYVAEWEQAGSFGVYFDIKNEGRLPITIEGLADEGGGDSLLPQLRLHNGVDEQNRFIDFHPFELGAGETAFLGLEALAAEPCVGYVPGGSITWDSVTLRYSYARIFERQATLPLPVAMSLAC